MSLPACSRQSGTVTRGIRMGVISKMARCTGTVVQSFVLRFVSDGGEPPLWSGTLTHVHDGITEPSISALAPAQALRMVRKALSQTWFERILGPVLQTDGTEDFLKRGFSHPNRARCFEANWDAFIGGHDCALRFADHGWALKSSLLEIAEEHRGFWLEGAAAGMAMAECLTGAKQRLRKLMQEFESTYLYSIPIGVGWAISRFSWRRGILMNQLPPFTAPFVFDGVGYRDACLNLERTLRRTRDHGVWSRAYDQGIGRGLWVGLGASPAEIFKVIATLSPERHPDLWAGVGLAATYVGGGTRDDVCQLLSLRSALRPWLARGSAFGAEARHGSGYVPDFSEEACTILTGAGVQSAAALVRSKFGEAAINRDTADADRHQLWLNLVMGELSDRR
jgi:hypothetical protein